MPRKTEKPGTPASMTPEEFRALTGVSRETLDRLWSYSTLLYRWSRQMNLVSRESLDDLWRRHMYDSAQLLHHLPSHPVGRQRVLIDLGSGAGFPGLVLAILGAGDVHLVESDQRKTVFLREVARTVGCDAHIHGVRIEQLRRFSVDVVTARALAPLPKLMELARPFLDAGAIGLFLKGARVDEELTALDEGWTMSIERLESKSDSMGTILRVGASGR